MSLILPGPNGSQYLRRRLRTHRVASAPGRAPYSFIDRLFQLEVLERRLMLDGTSYVVNSLADVVASDGFVTLREAIEAANENEAWSATSDVVGGSATEADVITFDQVALSAEAGVSFGEAFEIGLGGEELSVTDSLVIQGPGEGLLSIDAQWMSQVMHVSGVDTEVSLSDLTLTRGMNEPFGGAICNYSAMTLTNVTVSDSSASTFGGGIYCSGGTLTLENASVADNEAQYGGGICCGNGATLMLTDSIVRDNLAVSGLANGGQGGGIYSYQGALTLLDSSVFGNEATGTMPSMGFGGGVFSFTGPLTVEGSSVSGNSAGRLGGGVFFSTGALAILNTTLSGNDADSGGGLIIGTGEYEATITNCTVLENSATWTGGGLAGDTETLRLNNTIVAGNECKSSGIPIDISGTVDPASAYNLIGDVDTSGGLEDRVNGNIVGVDPHLAPVMTGNGPAVFGYVPQTDSPAEDAGSNALAERSDGSPLLTDQMGWNRTVNGTADIGSVERPDTSELLLPPVSSLRMNQGESAKLEVSLVAPPLAPVTVSVTKLSGTPSLSADLSSIVFDDTNWDVPRILTFASAWDTIPADQRADFVLSAPGLADRQIDVSAHHRTHYVVDTIEDVVAVDGRLSLREALEAANSNFTVNEAPAGSTANPDLIEFHPSLEGTAVALTEGELEIDDDVVILGKGPNGSAMTIDADWCSRIFSVTPEASAILQGLALTGGYAEDGGAIYSAGTLTLRSTVVWGNSSYGDGGGIHTVGTLTLEESVVADNHSYDGGGIYIENDSTVFIVNSTLSENIASGGGGGIYSDSPGGLSLTNATVVANSARFGGGMVGNMPILNNTIVAGNVADWSEQIDGTVDSTSAHNLIGNADSSGGLTDGVNGNIVGVDALLAPVMTGDGTVPLYYVPQTDSPAVDAGSSALAVDPSDGPLTLDQAGWLRIANGVVDIGAVERPVTPELLVSPSSYVTMFEGDSLSVEVSLVAAPAEPMTVLVTKLPGGSALVNADVSELVFGETDWNNTQTMEITSEWDLGSADETACFEFSSPGIASRQVSVTALDRVRYVVDTLEDVGAADGQLSLREAIEAANQNRIIQDAVAGSDTRPDYITFDESLAGRRIILHSSELYISDDIEIRGPGDGSRQITIDGNGESGIFRIETARVTMKSLTLTGGAPWGIGPGASDGGGIYSDGGTLMLTDLVIVGNTAYSGGGIYNNGGAMTLTNVTVSGNSASNRGGAIVNVAGTVNLTSSIVEGNSSEDVGGGIHNVGVLTLTGSTIVGNSSSHYGGGICSYGTLTLTNVTVSGNSATFGGGGVYNNGGAVTLNNAIVSGNTRGGQIADDIDGSFTGISSLVGVDPGFVRNPFAGQDGLWGTEDDDYGDLRILLPNSPAVDAGDGALLPADEFDLDGDGNIAEPLPVDLSGNRRVRGLRVDVGAYEYQGIPGDANGDGVVTDADYTIWADNYDATGAIWSMGDFSGDGSVSDADYTIWADHYGQSAPPIPGDANGDRAVTDADYTVWADNYGATGATQSMGDFSGDGNVTDADYTLWADNYGAGAGAATSTNQPVSLAVVASPSQPTLAVVKQLAKKSVGPVHRRVRGTTGSGGEVEFATRSSDYPLRDDAVLTIDTEAEEADLLAILSVPELV